MASSIFWMAFLAILYIFVSFSTPVKAPPADKLPDPVTEVIEEPKAEAPTAVTEAHTPETAVDPAALIEQGKKVYTANCLTCHNKDPNVKGAIGPELVDAPIEVMTVKVRTGRYPDVLPAGFVPKRKTKQMRKFPQLEADVPAIHAYIQSLKKK